MLHSNSIVHVQYILYQAMVHQQIQHSQAYDVISSTICQYFTSIIPQVHAHQTGWQTCGHSWQS